MSWPTDDRPRFVTTEMHWIGGRGRRLPQMDVGVLDRAFSHAIVWTGSTVGDPRARKNRGYHGQCEGLRNRARGLAAMLEAEHATKGTEA